jgi:hypothetical protein
MWALLRLVQMNDLLGSIRRLGAQAKDGGNAMHALKKAKKAPASGGGRGDLLSAIQQGVPLKNASERKDRNEDARPQPQRRMSLHDVMVDAMGGMRGLMGTISDDGSAVSSDSDVSD